MIKNREDTKKEVAVTVSQVGGTTYLNRMKLDEKSIEKAKHDKALQKTLLSELIDSGYLTLQITEL